MHKSKLTLEDFVTPDVKGLIESASTVDISGYGEVMISPEFKTLVDSLSKNRTKFSMSTNGYAFIPEMVDYLNNSSLYYLTVSLNSLNPITYKRLMGVDGLEQVLSNLEYLYSIKRNFILNISVVLNELVISELEDFVRYTNKNKVNKLRLSPLIANNTEHMKELIIKDNTKYIDALVSVTKLAKELGVSIVTPNLSQDKSVVDIKKKRCRHPWNTTAVDCNMYVIPCCFLGSMIMGNLKEETFEEIWNGDKYWDLRDSITNGNIKYCQKCLEFG
jgi:MoaA/NifB/PqqE/SkfB family radical SAM enzyme